MTDENAVQKAKYHETILEELEACQLDEDPIGAVRLINLAMKTDVNAEHAGPIRDKIKETLEWMKPHETDSSRVNDCIIAAQAWLDETEEAQTNEAPVSNEAEVKTEAGETSAETVETPTDEKAGCGCNK